MGADKPDIDDAVRIVDPDHDTILVTRNVKDNAAILEDTRAPDVTFDVWRLRPISLPHLSKPGHHRLTSVGNAGSLIEKGFDRAERYDPHCLILAWSHTGTKGFIVNVHGQSLANVFIITLNSLLSDCARAYLRGR